MDKTQFEQARALASTFCADLQDQPDLAVLTNIVQAMFEALTEEQRSNVLSRLAFGPEWKE